MLINLPVYIIIVFIITVIITLSFFYLSIRKSSSTIAKSRANRVLIVMIGWLLIQAGFTINNIYRAHPDTVPIRLGLGGVLPIMLAIIILFSTTSGRKFIDSLSLKFLTYLHVVRIPVELVLYWLFIHKAVPQIMTFEGRNFDIIAGLTAPLIGYFTFSKKLFSTKILLIWNFICLGLLLNIVITAVLSAPFPFQQLAFDQPNIGILYFPFNWLPTFIVPVVLFSHLTSIRQLLRNDFISQK